MLLGMASIGGVTPISLLVLVLAVAAVTSLLARPTVGWLARARRRGPDRRRDQPGWPVARSQPR